MSLSIIRGAAAFVLIGLAVFVFREVAAQSVDVAEHPEKPRALTRTVRDRSNRVGDKVWVTWEEFTPVQLRFRVQNDTDDIIKRVQFTVTGLGLIGPNGRRIPTRGAYNEAGKFVGPYDLVDHRKLRDIFPGPDEAQKFAFVHRDGTSMRQTGWHGTSAREVLLPGHGDWEFDLTLTWDDKTLAFQIRVHWDGDKIAPVWLMAV